MGLRSAHKSLEKSPEHLHSRDRPDVQQELPFKGDAYEQFVDDKRKKRTTAEPSDEDWECEEVDEEEEESDGLEGAVPGRVTPNSKLLMFGTAMRNQ